MDVLLFKPHLPTQKHTLPDASTAIRLAGFRGGKESTLPIAYAAHEGRAYAVAGPFKWPELILAINALQPAPWSNKNA